MTVQYIKLTHAWVYLMKTTVILSSVIHMSFTCHPRDHFATITDVIAASR